MLLSCFNGGKDVESISKRICLKFNMAKNV